jgi:hypothetical protein
MDTAQSDRLVKSLRQQLHQLEATQNRLFRQRTQSVQLFHFPGSLCSQKCRLALAEKGVEWTSVVVDICAEENYAPSFLRLQLRARHQQVRALEYAW